MRCSPSLCYLSPSSIQWPSFPQLSVLFLLTNRINEQTVTDFLQFTTSYQLPPFIFKCFLLSILTPHSSLQKLLFTNIVSGCFIAPFRKGGWRKKWKNKRWKDRWGQRTTLKAAEGEIDFKQALRNKCKSSSMALLGFSFLSNSLVI